MKLKEFEGKQLFASCGISVSSGVLVHSSSELRGIDFSQEYIAKVQTLQGGRKKKGGVQIIDSLEKAEQFVNHFLGKEFHGEVVNEILFDELVDIASELYIGLLFDTTLRQPVLLVSPTGGIDVESDKNLVRIPFDYVQGIDDGMFAKVCEALAAISSLNLEELHQLILRLHSCFVEYDLRMVEINPLVIDTQGTLIAVDSVAVLDDDAKHRWCKKVDFTERVGSRKATAREIAAHQIDAEDHRGVAGKTFLDLDGDIAILTSGGGASMTLVDTLVRLGGKPANFTEYSGNPPKEKVEKLTRIVLDKPGLSGLLVAGVIANFTNIKETLQGILDVLIEQKPDYPIVIRRAGPYDAEAKEMLMAAKEEYGLDIHYFGEEMILSKAAELMKQLSDEYKTQKEIHSSAAADQRGDLQ